MKSKLLYVTLMLVTLLACSDEFTESTAFGALSDENLQNATGVELALTGAYSLLDGIANVGFDDWAKSGDGWWYDAVSDDAHKGSEDSDQADLFLLETFDWNAGNPYLLGKWKALYAGVNRCNAVLNIISTIEEGDFRQQEAEARFLRAHFYFELAKGWGEVPFISLENFQAVEFNQPKQDVWDEIESDMKFALDVLGPDSELGRPNTWTATAYLGKIHLYQGEWAEALTYLETVINLGGYSLLDEFTDNFRLAGENGSESVFSIQFTADAGQSFNGNRGATLNFPQGGPAGTCCGFYQPSQDLANTFKTENGLPLLDTYNDSDIDSDFLIGSDDPFTPYQGTVDPRLDYTVGRRGIDFNGYGYHVGRTWIRGVVTDMNGPYLNKKAHYWAGEDANAGTGGWGQQRSGINYHIIRYADVLLMAAEAAVETGALDKATSWVNEVRQRAVDMTYLKDVDNPNQDAANYDITTYPQFTDAAFARKAVRFERRLELGVEGHRLFDIRRWGDGVQVMNEYIANESRTVPPVGDKSKPYQERHNVFPIPIEAIDLSGGALEQNPLWN